MERLLHALGGDEFLWMTNHTLDQAMQGAGFSQHFLNEVVTPIMRVNYGQSVKINAFVGEEREEREGRGKRRGERVRREKLNTV